MSCRVSRGSVAFLKYAFFIERTDIMTEKSILEETSSKYMRAIVSTAVVVIGWLVVIGVAVAPHSARSMSPLPFCVLPKVENCPPPYNQPCGGLCTQQLFTNPDGQQVFRWECPTKGNERDLFYQAPNGEYPVRGTTNVKAGEPGFFYNLGFMTWVIFCFQTQTCKDECSGHFGPYGQVITTCTWSTPIPTEPQFADFPVWTCQGP
jgi:hypothetical protein